MTNPEGNTARRRRENLDQLHDAGTKLHGCVQDFEVALNRLRPTLNQGHPWGTDEAGTLFAHAYSAVLGKAVNVLESHVAMLQAGADALHDWADRSADTETANARRIEWATQGLETEPATTRWVHWAVQGLEG